MNSNAADGGKDVVADRNWKDGFLEGYPLLFDIQIILAERIYIFEFYIPSNIASNSPSPSNQIPSSKLSYQSSPTPHSLLQYVRKLCSLG
jgi:hypothetical protein